MATISPNNPIASAKMRIKIIPTNIFGSIAFALTPISPTTPIANPDAYNVNKIISITKAEKPQQRPAEKCLYPVKMLYASRTSTKVKD